ncbi:MAG TPA: alpha/beta fold hydrolase [Bryobacteraceae bacterium]|nr:alpha/beta fold hydrolase [Bryobacteraceae bacterium]
MRLTCILFGCAVLAFGQPDPLKLLTPTTSKATARINATDRTWEEWLQRSGERPPDFSKLPAQPFLPDPLAGVKTREEWSRRREEIRGQFERWVFGRMPPKPDNLRASIVAQRQEGAFTVRDVLLEFGPGHRARLNLQLIVPPGQGPFPVFLTNHPRSRPWVLPAVRRGYIGCIYFAADPIYGPPDDSDGYIEAYPEYDFSAVARWAWAGMRAVDYLHTLANVDKDKIGIAGHSRNGKQALIAAAFDERIAAAVPSSGNTGEGNPWRYTTDTFANETVEQITSSFPGWFHPRLRFFAGREQYLPVDQNLLMAMVAPRGLLMASAYSEGQGAPFGFEHAFDSVAGVYRFLDAESRLGLSLRAGEHATTAEDIESYVDFFDSVFGRGTRPPPRTRLMPTLPKLRTSAPPPANLSTAERMRWMLGTRPPDLPFPARSTTEGRTMTSDGWLAGLYERPLKGKGFTSISLGFGDDLKGDLYLPSPRPEGKLKVVVWLHSYAHATGYSRYARSPIENLTARGYAVLAFDQIGYGTRIHQATRFYERYPEWSLLGKMIDDTSAAVSALLALEAVDSAQIWLAGWSLGGKVGLWTAALDARVAGVLAASAFTPLRTAPASTEGLAHYTTLHKLLPRLEQFRDKSSAIPVDYDEIIAAISPRPVYIRAPLYDRYASLDDVRKAAEGKHVTISTPADFHRFGPAAQQEAFRWLP